MKIIKRRRKEARVSGRENGWKRREERDKRGERRNWRELPMPEVPIPRMEAGKALSVVLPSILCIYVNRERNRELKQKRLSSVRCHCRRKLVEQRQVNLSILFVNVNFMVACINFESNRVNRKKMEERGARREEAAMGEAAIRHRHHRWVLLSLPLPSPVLEPPSMKEEEEKEAEVNAKQEGSGGGERARVWLRERWPNSGTLEYHFGKSA